MDNEAVQRWGGIARGNAAGEVALVRRESIFYPMNKEFKEGLQDRHLTLGVVVPGLRSAPDPAVDLGRAHADFIGKGAE